MNERVERLTLSVPETAKELGVSVKTAYDLVHRADFPTIRIGQRIRINREGLRKWINANTQNNNHMED